jgi:hypothetical protein
MAKTIRGKKGMDLTSALIIIVIFGAVFIVIAILYKEFLSVGESQFTQSQCQTSLLLTQGVGQLRPFCFQDSPQPISLKCSRNFITVSSTNVIKNGMDVTKLYDASCTAPGAQPLPAVQAKGVTTADEATARAEKAAKSLQKPQPSATNVCLPKNVVAEEMSACWNTFFKGEQVVLQMTDVAGWKLWSAKDYKYACFICGEITIKADKGLDGVVDYMKAKERSNGQSYYQFIANDSQAWCDPNFADKGKLTCWDGIRTGYDTSVWGYASNHPAISMDPLKKDTKYAVVFIRRGLGSCTDKETDTSASHQHLTNTVQLIPADQIGQVCDVVVT